MMIAPILLTIQPTQHCKVMEVNTVAVALNFAMVTELSRMYAINTFAKMLRLLTTCQSDQIEFRKDTTKAVR